MTTPVTAGVLLPYQYGRGYQELKRGVQPAAGAAFTLTVPGGEVWRVIAAQATLVTSAVVANRTPRFAVLDNDSNEVFRSITASSVSAGNTNTTQWATGFGNAISGAQGGQTAPLPDLFLDAGTQIQLTAGALDAGDQIQNVSLIIERLTTGPRGYPVGYADALPAQLDT